MDIHTREPAAKQGEVAAFFSIHMAEGVSNAGMKSRYGSEKLGAEVGAGSVWQYLRKLEGFARSLTGANRKKLGDGKVRYSQNGKYVILDGDQKNLSSGTVNN